MQQTNNINETKTEYSEFYTRHVGGTHVPERHDPKCLIVVHHELNQELEEEPKLFASIIVGLRGEDLFEGYRPSIEVTSDGPSLGFSTGVFGSHSRKGSILVPNVEFTALAMELHAASAVELDPYPDRIEGPSEVGRAVHYYFHGEDGPCETLRLLQHWNYFEDLGLSWEDRALALSWLPCGSNFLEEFQYKCELLGLEFGQRNPYEKQLNALDACLALLEVEHWKRIREIAAAALQHAEKNA